MSIGREEILVFSGCLHKKVETGQIHDEIRKNSL